MFWFPVVTQIDSIVIQHQPLSDLFEHQPETFDVGMNVSRFDVARLMIEHLFDVAPIEIEIEGDGAERVAKRMAGEAYADIFGHLLQCFTEIGKWPIARCGWKDPL